MKIIDCAQRSPEWYAARLGRLTASRVGEAFATNKKGDEAAGRRNTRINLVLERLTGRPQENGYTSPGMDHGTEFENIARAEYEAETGTFVNSVGFIVHDELMAGCSPDGLTAAGGIEIKCPKAATHLAYLRGGLPREYFLQCVHGLWLTGLDWWEFVSYHGEFPDALKLKVTRIYTKDVDLKAHELSVKLFLSEVDKEEQAVKALMAVPV